MDVIIYTGHIDGQITIPVLFVPVVCAECIEPQFACKQFWFTIWFVSITPGIESYVYPYRDASISIGADTAPAEIIAKSQAASAVGDFN